MPLEQLREFATLAGDRSTLIEVLPASAGAARSKGRTTVREQRAAPKIARVDLVEQATESVVQLHASYRAKMTDRSLSLAARRAETASYSERIDSLLESLAYGNIPDPKNFPVGASSGNSVLQDLRDRLVNKLGEILNSTLSPAQMKTYLRAELQNYRELVTLVNNAPKQESLRSTRGGICESAGDFVRKLRGLPVASPRSSHLPGTAEQFAEAITGARRPAASASATPLPASASDFAARLRS